jgi:hypothetical protein
MNSLQGTPVVLIAPITESINNSGLRMDLDFLPGWLEPVLSLKYPNWNEIPHNPDASAVIAPAELRTLQNSLKSTFGQDQVVVTMQENLNYFIGESTRIVGVTLQNPLGVSFLGSSQETINGKYTRILFRELSQNDYRRTYRIIVCGPGSKQIITANYFDKFGIDCAIDGPIESSEVSEIFSDAFSGHTIPKILKIEQLMKAEELSLISLVAAAKK